MKTILKVTLVIALFGSMAIADDGQMGSGGYQGCTGENCPPPPPCTENCGGNRADQNDGGETILNLRTAKITIGKLVGRYFLIF